EIDGIHYLTMAYVEGKPLSEFVRSGKPLPQRNVAAVVRKLALALHEAHERGVIHRDLKPSNVMIVSARRITFGISQVQMRPARCPPRVSRLKGRGVRLGLSGSSLSGGCVPSTAQQPAIRQPLEELLRRGLRAQGEQSRQCLPQVD